MTTEQMRQALLALYPYPRWAQKVNRMSDTQIFAVFTRFRREGKI